MLTSAAIWSTIVCACLVRASSPFVVPAAQLTVLVPRGFEVSIPAAPNVTLFSFHGQLNEPLAGREAGTWARDVVRVRDGRLTFRECETELRSGDVLYFWTFVVRDQLGYHQDDGKFVVSGATDEAVQPLMCSAPTHMSGYEVPAAELQVLQPRGFEVSIPVSNPNTEQPCSLGGVSGFSVPPAELKILRPRGFEVSIPADDGIELFAFHGQLNVDFDGGREAGTWAKDIVKVRDGRLTFRECETKLRNGDVIYFWTYVVWHGLGYHQNDGRFVISGITNDSSSSSSSVGQASSCAAFEVRGYEVPRAELRVLRPRGFEVSIPADDGISLFAFHGQLNEDFDGGRESGTWSKDIVKVRDGRYTFRDCNTKLQNGDVIFFWTNVVWHGLSYYQDDGKLVVSRQSEVDDGALVSPSCAPDYLRTSGMFKVPRAEFTILHPSGFQVSIPALEGISMFTFHGLLNQQFHGRDAGTWARDVVVVEDGRFTFRDTHAKLQNGDVINFWTFVVWHGLGYYQDNGSFVVSGILSTDNNEIVTTKPPHNNAFRLPLAELQILDPRGFEVSIPADDGITLFAFHGQLNVPFDGHEAGTWSRDVMRVKHGRFTFRDCNTKLQSGDVIYFWTFVVRNGLGLHQDDGIFVVDTNSNRNAVVSPSCGVRQSARGGGFRVPLAELVILQPRGFEVFIPAEEGITLFAFHGKLNNEMIGHEAGSWSRDVVKVRNGRFTFRDTETKLKTGDVINFWTFVVYNGLGYHQDDGTFTIQLANVSTDHKTTLPSASTILHPVASAVTPVACQKSGTRVNDGLDAPCAGQLLFEDNFDSLNESNWHIEQRFSSQPDHEFGIYLNRPDIVHVSDGHLSVGVVRLGDNYEALNAVQFGSNCTGTQTNDECRRNAAPPPIGIGQLSTARSFHFLYGRVEIRARLPYADWVFPQLWLQPADGTTYGTGGYASGQMRVAHATPGEPLQGGVLLGADAPFRLMNMCRAGNEAKFALAEASWRDEYHVYSLEWRPDNITVAIDDHVYCRISPPFTERRINGRSPPAATDWQQFGSGPMVPFDQRAYVTLGIGVGGMNDFSDQPHRRYPGGPKPWRNDAGVTTASSAFWTAVKGRTADTDERPWPGNDAKLLVDYVRVYAL